MKKILAGLFLCALSVGKAQSTSDYKYIIVPESFKDFEKEDYQLNTLLKTLLRKKKYEIVVENATNIPLEITQDQCLALRADIQAVKSSFQNKLNVVFTDCHQQIRSEYHGASKIKDFEKGYQDALHLAMNKLPLQNAKVPTKTSFKNTETSSVTEEVNGEIKIPIDSSNLKNTAYLFDSKGSTYQLIELSKTKAQLMDVQKQKIIAMLYPSSKDKVMHVEVLSDQGNYNTLGYVEGQNLFIEFKTGNETWTKTEFKSK
ncbi:hypothetical protein [Faecalibacter sp. LW9]|uniref:hypothetical protein n=1 Tax=Faecalibacter sp. LW9 TaxID=3103144 RepID=UPI002AFF0EBE|nr:hypothetical protein [Faecalibacter sp. LW9]